MATKTILQGDQQDLRQPSSDVVEFNQTLHAMLDALAETLHSSGGIGLAAPQIGCPVRAFVLDIGDGIVECVNPVITDRSGEQESVESCLSFPGLTLKLTRPQHVSVTTQDRFGSEHRFEATGLLARAVCHEIDHLDGELFMDHLSDEEVFEQVFMQLGESLEDDLDALLTDRSGTVETSLEAARREEIADAIGMLQDAAWKLTLATELLRDQLDLLKDLDIEELQRAADELSLLTERWESACQGEGTDVLDNE